MSTTISPGDGAGVLYTQAGQGSTPGFSAIDLRRILTGTLQEGVVEAGAFEVTERGAGANMSVDIAADDGFAYVQGDSITAQGLYCVPPHSASINEAITAADSTNPRIDQVVLEVRDNTHDASGGNEARVRVVAGTATSGATLANRTGALALPSNAIRLADVLVAANATSIANSAIRDRRPWARGGYDVITRNTNASSGDDYTTAATSSGAVDSTNLAPRIECSGAPLKVTLRGAAAHSAADNQVHIALRVDAVVLSGGQEYAVSGVPGSTAQGFECSWVVVPAAGSHVVAPYWHTNSGTATMRARSTQPLQLVIEELQRQVSANNATTTG